MWNFISGKKTYLLAFAGILYFLSAAMTGHMTWQDAINGIWASGIAASLRHAIQKAGA